MTTKPLDVFGLRAALLLGLVDPLSIFHFFSSSFLKTFIFAKKETEMARDKFHDNFKRALIKDGWTITHDPLRIQAGEVKGEVDLGAEKIFAAEKTGKILLVKSRALSILRLSMSLKKRMDNLGFTDRFSQNMKRDPIYIWLFRSLLTIHSFNAL
jgi:hypothetical protein